MYGHKHQFPVQCWCLLSWLAYWSPKESKTLRSQNIILKDERPEEKQTTPMSPSKKWVLISHCSKSPFPFSQRPFGLTRLYLSLSLPHRSHLIGIQNFWRFLPTDGTTDSIRLSLSISGSARPKGRAPSLTSKGKGWIWYRIIFAANCRYKWSSHAVQNVKSI